MIAPRPVLPQDPDAPFAAAPSVQCSSAKPTNGARMTRRRPRGQRHTCDVTGRQMDKDGQLERRAAPSFHFGQVPSPGGRRCMSAPCSDMYDVQYFIIPVYSYPISYILYPIGC
eukprot:355061-Chlamydomonas_euryale.AAC.10